MMQAINFISMLFGLIPHNREVLHSNFMLDYIMMIVVPVCYIFCYLLVTVYNRFSINMLSTCGSICRLSNALFIHLGAFLYITITLLSLYRRKKFFVEFEHNLCKIDNIIRKCQKVAELGKYKPSTLKHSFAYHFTWLFVFGVFMFSLYFDIKESYITFQEYAIIPLMVSSFPYLAGSIIQGEFIYHVSVISDRFSQINMLFERINQEASYKHSPVTVFDIENDGKQQQHVGSTKLRASPLTKSNIKLLNAQQQTYAEENNENTEELTDSSDDEYADDVDFINGTATKAANTGITSESNLPDLFKLHDKILTLSVCTNAEFGPQCVPYMAACFVISIFGIFLETKVNFIVSGKNRLLDYVTYLYVIWSLTSMIVAYLVLRLCCNANNHSKQSVMIVHEIMQKKPAFMLSNDLFYNKMKSFTLQFLHWEGYFQFNGIGLFALDYTFIFSTVSAATSYLIVLLQFDMSTVLKNERLLS